jgi:parallel beta-helix repeat protein
LQNTKREGIGIQIGNFLLCTHVEIKNNIIQNTSIGILTPSTLIGNRHHHHIMNNIIVNSSEYGMILKVTDYCKVKKNSFISNNCGVNLEWSIGNMIGQNNFIENDIDAIFDSSFLTHGSGNYYSNHEQKFPHIIHGTLFDNEYPWFNVDWHPANEAYDTNMKHAIV